MLAHELHAQIRFVDESDIHAASVEGVIDNARGSLFSKMLVVFRDPISYSEQSREQLAAHYSSSADIVFWERGNPDARILLHKLLKKHANVMQFQKLTSMDQGAAWVAAYLREHADTDSASMSRDAMLLLLQRVGFDTFALASELQKLLAYHVPISRADVENIVPERMAGEASAFPLLDAISVKNSKAAIAQLQSMITSGASERFIISMIAYQYRLLLAIRMGMDQRIDAAHISRVAKLHPIAVQKAGSLARRFSMSAIQEALVRIAGTERAMNSNKTMDARSIVTMLVSSLTV